MVEEVQRDKGPEQYTDMREREREMERGREGGREGCVHILQDFSRRSGLLTLAFSANCYSFTLPLYPRTLDRQSLHVKCVQWISQRVCTSHVEEAAPLLELTRLSDVTRGSAGLGRLL